MKWMRKFTMQKDRKNQATLQHFAMLCLNPQLAHPQYEERQTCIAISKIHSSTIYFVPFNRLTTTNLIHQGVNVQRFFTVAQLFVRLFFSCALQTLGGWPHFLGFQMTWHFFLSLFCIFLYSCAIFPRWFQCSVCSMLMLPKGSVNKHTWAVLLARIIFHYAHVDVVGVGFFFASCLWLHNTTILYYFIIPWYEVLSSIPFKLWNYAKQRLSESHDSPFKFEYELQLSWTTAVVFRLFSHSVYSNRSSILRERGKKA